MPLNVKKNRLGIQQKSTTSREKQYQNKIIIIKKVYLEIEVGKKFLKKEQNKVNLAEKYTPLRPDYSLI